MVICNSLIHVQTATQASNQIVLDGSGVAAAMSFEV